MANAACGTLVLAAVPTASVGVMARGLAAQPVRRGINLLDRGSDPDDASRWDYSREADEFERAGWFPMWRPNFDDDW